MHKKYNWIFIIILSSLIFGCKNKNEDTQTQDAEQIIDENVITLTNAQLKSAGIETAVLGQSKLGEAMTAYGKTFFPPEKITTIASPFGGIVKSLPIVQGQYVYKGQLIAILEDPKYIDIQQDYLLTQSKLKLTQQDYERQRDLNQVQANSNKVYQQAENEWKTQKILLQSLAEKLKLLGINPIKLSEKSITRQFKVRASSSGYVSSVYVNIGKYISSSENILDIIQTDKPYLKLKVYEKDLPKLYIGMRLLAHLISDTGIQYPCVIKSINPLISNDGSADVICSFVRAEKNIFQNTNMIAKIELSNPTTNSLPKDAIVLYEGKNYVFIQEKKNRYKMQPINIGTSKSDFTEVLNPDEFKGKTIVSQGAYTLLMSLKNKD